MIKAIFFDIDGTLITNNNRILKSTKKALAQLKEKGYLLGLATSRGLYNLPSGVQKLPFDFFVLFNGQYIVDFKKNRLLEQPLSKEILLAIQAYAQTNELQVVWQALTGAEGNWLMRLAQSRYILPFVHWLKNKISPTCLQFFYHLRHFVSFYRPQSFQRNIYQVSLLQPQKADVQTKAALPDVHLTRSNPFTVDLVTKGQTKSVGIAKVLAPYHIELSDVMFFGDSYNDLEVMEAVGYGIAMGNGIAELKEKSIYVTGSHQEGGIAQALQAFGLIKEE